jgi:hypothetical protein
MKDLNAADQAAAILFSSRDFIFVLPGLVPGIHVFLHEAPKERRGRPGQAPAMTAYG